MAKLELLSPAGDMERLKMSVLYGADSVYLAGTSFGMRSFAGNFTPEELPVAVKFAHDHGVKVHVTVNTMPRNDEVIDLPAYLQQLDDADVDALIVADLGAFTLAGKYAPHCERHISTQQSIANYECAQAWYDLGAKRVVLARECSLKEVAEIRAKTSRELEIETFGHGAMCVSYSGRCLLSSYMTGRDANRGDCAQPCRWSYSLMEQKRPGQYFDITETDKGTYILNANDLCMAEHIDDLVRAGVTSFKIEGRAKSHYYVAVTTNAYRGAIDAWASDPDAPLPQWVTDELSKISHRTYSTGFFYGRPENGQTYPTAGYERDYAVAAVVEGYEDGKVIASLKNKFSRGTVLDCLEPGHAPFAVPTEQLTDEAGNTVDAPNRPTMLIGIPFERAITAGSLLRMKSE